MIGVEHWLNLTESSYCSNGQVQRVHTITGSINPISLFSSISICAYAGWYILRMSANFCVCGGMNIQISELLVKRICQMRRFVLHGLAEREENKNKLRFRRKRKKPTDVTSSFIRASWVSNFCYKRYKSYLDQLQYVRMRYTANSCRLDWGTNRTTSELFEIAVKERGCESFMYFYRW